MTKTITLPTGKTATIKEGKGFDLLKAQRNAKTSDEIPYALIAELAEIDGQKLVYEDVLELDLEDVIALQTAISGKFQEATIQPQPDLNQKTEEAIVTINSLTANP